MGGMDNIYASVHIPRYLRICEYACQYSEVQKTFSFAADPKGARNLLNK